MEKERVITVYNHDKPMDYNEHDYYEYFKFSNRPDFNKIDEICIHTSLNGWLEIVFNDGRGVKIYNNIFGTYVQQ